MTRVIDLLKSSERVGDYYSEKIESNLKTQLNDIMGKLEVKFQKKIDSEGMLLNNLNHKSIMPFTYKTRIKSKLSLEEKVIRNDMEFTEVNSDAILTKFDDLIGITILTTTMGYHDQAHGFLLEIIEEIGEDIKFVSNKESKKCLFGNDRIQYYHLKLSYKGYPVEIQIKSIFLSAFADIEHTLFYKDHDIHELKNYNKKIMYSLAPILIDLEDILHGIYTHEKSYIESESLKTKIYDYIHKNKGEIFGIEEDNDKGRLNFAIKNATELLSIYYSGSKETFEKDMELNQLEKSQDLDIINLLYEESIEYIVISSMLTNESEFFKCYLIKELGRDGENASKVHLLEGHITRFLNSLVYLKNDSGFGDFETIKDTNLKSIIESFIGTLELFEESIEEVLEMENEVLKFIESCLILPHIVKDKDELNDKGVPVVKNYLKEKEDSEDIDLSISEKIFEFIMKEWKK